MRSVDEMIAVEEHWPVVMQDRDRGWLLAHTAEDLVYLAGLREHTGRRVAR